jgi:hypothetical protein
VNILAGILFHVDAHQANPATITIAENIDISAAAYRGLVLTNLVALGQVGIEVAFTIKD